MEKKGDRDEKMLSTKIAWLLGKGSLKEFETNRNPEVSDFRLDMVEKCKRAIEFHNGASWEERVSYCYPSEIDPNSEKNRLIDDRMQAQVFYNYICTSSKYFVHVRTVRTCKYFNLKKCMYVFVQLLYHLFSSEWP